MSAWFDPSALIVLVVGAVILLTAWLPLVLRFLPMSLPIVAVALGYLLMPPSWFASSEPTPFHGRLLERLAEFVVLIALMGAGLRIERPLAWKTWSATFRLLIVAMPLTIFAVAWLGSAGLGLAWSSALLLGAVLAPTDPVLAADVQALPPGAGEGGDVRFAITSEAGLNDGLAFPFVLLAIALVTQPFAEMWPRWVAFDVVWKIGVGAAIGFAAGRTFGWLTFRLPRLKLSKTGDGLVAVGVTLISYAASELLDSYGFIAVFIAAVTLRATDRGHDFHAAMAEFSEQVERVLMVLVMMIFGGAIAAGLLAPLGWREIAAGLAVLLVVRPLAGWISLIGVPLPRTARAMIAFFGIRGIGTFYYMAYAFGRASFEDATRLVAIASFVVLASVLMHGASSTPLMKWADGRRAAHGKAAPGEPVRRRRRR